MGSFHVFCLSFIALIFILNELCESATLFLIYDLIFLKEISANQCNEAGESMPKRLTNLKCFLLKKTFHFFEGFSLNCFHDFWEYFIALTSILILLYAVATFFVIHDSIFLPEYSANQYNEAA